MTDTARERAIEMLQTALELASGVNPPRAIAASIVNEIIAACGEETWTANHARATEEAIEQLTRAVLVLAQLLGVNESTLARAVEELEERARNKGAAVMDMVIKTNG